MLCSRKGISRSSCGCKLSARVAKVLMERALTNSISPSIFTSLFMPHPGQPEETGEKALKTKRGLNPVGFSGRGTQNGWKRSSPGLPCALTQVSDPGGIAGCAAGGVWASTPLPAPPKGTADRRQSQALPAAGTGQTPLSRHCFPFDVTAGGTAREAGL